METTNCPNCNHIIEEHFCPNCGEKRFKRLSMKDIVADFLSNLINLEGPVLNTIKDLTLRPGQMINDYLNGKRKTYYRPFQFYLLVITIYFIFYYLWGNEMMEMFNNMGAKYNTTATHEQMNEFQQKVTKFHNENMQLFTFLMVPLYGWLIWLFFRKKSGHSFVEILVATLYIMAQSLIFGIISSFTIFVHPSLPMILGFIFLLFYLPWVLKQLYQESMGVTILKSIAIIIIGFILYSILIGIISVAWLILTK